MREQILFDSFLRQRLAGFIAKAFQQLNPGQRLEPTWFLEEIAWKLEQCRRGDIRRLIVTLPPRHLKSHIGSVAFPAFVLGHDPARRVLCITSSKDGSARLARKCRAIMREPWYQRAFHEARLAHEKRAAADFMTTKHGHRRSSFVGSLDMDRDAEVIVIDDPMTAEDAASPKSRREICAWFDTLLATEPAGDDNRTIILIATRHHQDDLAGHLLQKNEGWTELRMPAIESNFRVWSLYDDRGKLGEPGRPLWPERQSRGALEGIRERIGNSAFEAQYQQAPLPDISPIIRWEWIKFFIQPQPRGEDDRIRHSWYLPPGSTRREARSVLTKWQITSDGLLLLDVRSALFSHLELLTFAEHEKEQDPSARFYLSDNPEGHAIYEHICPRSEWTQTLCVPVDSNLITRARLASTFFEERRVFVPMGSECAAEVQRALLNFPGGA
jgi:hypothetical protein